MKDGRVPDLESFGRAVRKVSEQFSIRGVELVVEGELAQVDGKPALRLTETGETLLLVPLEHKVQWDKKQNREAAATDEEKAAFERLTKSAAGTRVVVTGPATGEPGKPVV